MNAHRSLSRQQVYERGPAHIASMVASEFYRAASRAKFQNNVLSCYERARELMGILETIPMPFQTAKHLSPLYRRCTAAELARPDRLDPSFMEKANKELAEEFNKVSHHLGLSHA